MSRLVAVLTFCVVAAHATVTRAEDEPIKAQAADLAAPVQLLADGRPIEVGGFAAPCHGDFDEDGRKDLLVGQYVHGRLRIYRNIGTNAEPKFDQVQWFTAGGRIAGVPHCCQAVFTPQLIDFDGDDRDDIITGSGYSGEVFLYRRKANGSFARAEVLCNRDGEVQMHRHLLSGRVSSRRYNVTALAYDWERDGDLDLLLGTQPLCLVLNTGTLQDPSFDGGRLIDYDGEPIRGGLGAPQMADWDGDGRDDLIAGATRDIVWYRNVGEPGQPQFEPPRLLVPNTTRVPSAEAPAGRPGLHHAFAVADFNADGRLDLLVGDRFRRTARTIEDKRDWTDAQEAEYDELGDRYSDLRRSPRDETAALRIERYRTMLDVWQEYDTLRNERNIARGLRDENRGFVWYFERLDPSEE